MFTLYTQSAPKSFCLHHIRGRARARTTHKLIMNYVNERTSHAAGYGTARAYQCDICSNTMAKTRIRNKKNRMFEGDGEREGERDGWNASESKQQICVLTHMVTT